MCVEVRAIATAATGGPSAWEVARRIGERQTSSHGPRPFDSYSAAGRLPRIANSRPFLTHAKWPLIRCTGTRGVFASYAASEACSKSKPLREIGLAGAEPYLPRSSSVGQGSSSMSAVTMFGSLASVLVALMRAFNAVAVVV